MTFYFHLHNLYNIYQILLKTKNSWKIIIFEVKKLGRYMRFIWIVKLYNYKIYKKKVHLNINIVISEMADR